jgi:hypothetical protein
MAQPRERYWIVCHRGTIVDWNHSETDQAVKHVYIEEHDLDEGERAFLSDLNAKQAWNATPGWHCLQAEKVDPVKGILGKSRSFLKFPATVVGIVYIHEWTYSRPTWEEVRVSFEPSLASKQLSAAESIVIT